MSEVRTKLIGSSIPNLNNGKKYFHFAVLTGANVNADLVEYLTRKLPKFFKSYEHFGANVEIDGYSNEGFGVSIIWEIMDAPLNGDFTEREAAQSTFDAVIHDIKDLAGEGSNYFLFNCDHTMDKDFVLKTLESIRRDIVFKSDLYAGKLLGEAAYDLELLYNFNKSLSSDEGKVNLDEATKDANKTLAVMIQERDNLKEQILSIDKSLKAATAKLETLNSAISQEEAKLKGEVPEEPNSEEKLNIEEVLRQAQNENVLPKDKVEYPPVKEEKEPVVEPKEDNKTVEVTRNTEEVENQDAQIAKINNVLDNLKLNIEATDTTDIKEKIEEVTSDVNKVTEEAKGEEPPVNTTQIITDEVRVVENKDASAEILKGNIDTPLAEEKTIYDDMNQKRDIKSYIENIISSDSDFSGDWEDESELFQIVVSNDSKAREELSVEEYKEYVDFIQSNTLGKEHEPNTTGVYNLRKVKYSSIGAFDYIANGTK